MIDTLKLIRQVNQSELTSSEKLTLIACIYKVSWTTWQADYPISIQSISDECGLSKATVKRSLKSLEAQGYVSRSNTSWKGGQGASLLEVNPQKLSNGKGDQVEPRGVQVEPRGEVKLSLGGGQIEPRGVQVESHIYPIYSKPILPKEEAPASKSSIDSLSMQEYLESRAKEQREWESRRKVIQ